MSASAREHDRAPTAKSLVKETQYCVLYCPLQTEKVGVIASGGAHWSNASKPSISAVILVMKHSSMMCLLS